jgi:hypothetical protein
MKKKELESNLLNDIFYAAMPERKIRPSKQEPQESEEDSEYLDDLREKKRARYEALKLKAREGWGE